MELNDLGIDDVYVNELSGIVRLLCVTYGDIPPNGRPHSFSELDSLPSYAQRVPEHTDRSPTAQRRIKLMEMYIDRINSLITQGSEDHKCYHALAGRISFLATGEYRGLFQKDTLRYDSNQQ